MIDFHCHLDLYPKPDQVAEDCRDRGMYVLSVTTTPSAWNGTRALSREGDLIRTALGLHPQLAHERLFELPLFDDFLPETRYVGEVGLDGAPEFGQHWDAQTAAFEHILAACRAAGGRVLSIHSRRASPAVLDHLEANHGFGTAVLHWFSGNFRDLDRAVGLGCWFSVGPDMLRSKHGRALAAKMPPDRVLTESDGPFAQTAGCSVMPWQVKDALLKLSELWAFSPEKAERIILANLRNLVKKA